MRHSNLLILSIFLLLLLPFTLFSQVPDGVNYQAVVRGPLGLPLNSQTVDVRFTIHQGSPTGTSVFQEVHNTTTNQFGLINLELGSVNSGAFSVINWGTGGAYYLQIEVDAGLGFDDLGASQLLSVPYALFAKSAATGAQGFNSLLDTMAAGASCPNGGYQVLLGLDTNANTVLDPIEVTSSFFVCNGTSGLSINWIGSSTIFPAGNPYDAFYNSADGISYIYNGTTLTWDTLAAGGTSTLDNDWVVNGVDMYTDPAITGHVGIGTNTPLKKLHIESNFNGGDGIIINNTTLAGNPGLEFQTQGNPRFVLGVDQSDNNKFKIGTSGVNVNSRFTIDSQGKLGIGNTNPIHQLTVFSPDTVIASFTSSNPSASVISVWGTNPNAFVGSILLSGPGGLDTTLVGVDPAQKLFYISNLTPNGHTAISADSSVSLYGKQVGNIASNLIYNQAPSVYNEADTIFNYSGSGANIHVNQGNFITDSLYLLGGTLTSGYILANGGNGKALWTDPSTLGLGGGLWQSNTPDIYFNTGNVGINTNTPTSPLTIQSVVGNDIEFTGGSNADIRSSAQLLLIGINSVSMNSSLSNVRLQTASIDRLTVLNTGEVGIGTSTPTGKLEVAGGSIILRDQTDVIDAVEIAAGSGVGASGSVALKNSGTTTVSLSGIGTSWFNAGNVGIGTTTPNANLDVTGTIETDNLRVLAGAGTVGDVLTSDASGNASWQNISGDGDGIYDGSGALSANTIVTQGANTLAFTSTATNGFSVDGNTFSVDAANDRIGIGATNPTAKLEIDNTVEDRSLEISNTNNSANFTYLIKGDNAGTGTGDKYGTYLEATGGNTLGNNTGVYAGARNASVANRAFSGSATASGTSTATGIFASAAGSGSGVTYGVYGQNSSSATGVSYGGYFRNMNLQGAIVYGVRSEVTGAATNDQYGFRADVSGGASANTRYGIYANVINGATNWAAYFAAGNVYVNDNVGIGVLAPSSKLDVNGNVEFSGDLRPNNLPGAVGEVLTSQGAGIAPIWQAPAGGSLWNQNGSDINYMAGKVGIGIASPVSSFNIIYSGTDTEASLVNYTSTTNVGTSTGLFVSADKMGGGSVYAGGFRINAVTTSAEAVAVDATNFGNATINYGLRTTVSGSGTTNYGIYSEVNGAATNWAAYFALGGVYIGNNLQIPTGAGAGKVLTSDASGNATWKDKRIAFEVRGSTNQNIDNTPSLLQYDVETFDEGGNFDPSAGNYSFNAPVFGVYSFQANVLFDYSSAGPNDITIVELLVNGVPQYRTNTPIVNGERTTNNISTTVKLNAGDVVQVRVYVINGLSIITTGGADEVWFSGHLVYAY